MKLRFPATVAKLPPRVGRHEAGFTVLELLIVLVVSVILTVALVTSLRPGQKSFYAADIQASQLLDMFRDANLRALNDRRGYRVVINYTRGTVSLLDEANNRTLRVVPTGSASDVRMSETPPSNFLIGALPTFNGFLKEYNTVGEQVVNIRFRSDNTITRTDGTVTSGRLFIWQPIFSTDGEMTPLPPKLGRAITIFGPSNGIQLWKYRDNAFTIR